MAFDMIEAMTLIARDKNIDFDSVVRSLEESLLAAARKKYAETDNLSFRFDKKTNELFMVAAKRVVDKVDDPDLEISLPDAQEIDNTAQLGDELEIYMDYEAEFGRNAIANAKQILAQKIREVEHERIYNEYIDKVRTIVSGVVQQIDKGIVIVNLGRGEGIMPPREQIPREKFRQGDRIRAYILDVQSNPRGPQIILSRVSNEFLRALFALEVPEIYERVIEIKMLAREPGERSKVAVFSSDDRIDPVGACVGIKGVRVQSIVRELNNERIDIVPFSTNGEVFVTRALAPAKVVHIDTFDLEQKMTVVVEDEKLSLAIGRSGQNARLASKLTGWKVNILSESEYKESKKREAELLLPVSKLPGVGARIQERLIEADINSVQRLAITPIEILTRIEGLGEKTAESLIAKAAAMVSELEQAYDLKQEELKASEELHAKDVKLSAHDIFEDEPDTDLQDDDESGETESSASPETEPADSNEFEPAETSDSEEQKPTE